MPREFDLLGDPIPDNHGSVGANGHTPTAENVNKVRLLVVADWTSAEIAEELGVSVPTLNKHYFRNKSIKHAKSKAVSEARGRVLMQLNKAADDGNVPAQKEMLRIFDKVALEEAAKSLPARKPKQPKKGKKEQAHDEAIRAAGAQQFLPDYGGKGRPN